LPSFSSRRLAAMNWKPPIQLDANYHAKTHIF
jgi:hypothetical protein